MTDQSFLEAERDRILTGEDRDLYLRVGYFFSWLNQVDLQLTTLMAVVMPATDLASFELLLGRIGAKTKLHRLRQLCKIKNRVIEQSLLDRLTHYEKTICELRNRLAHSALARDENQPRFYYVSVTQMPWTAFGQKVPPVQKVSNAIDPMELFERGYWLHNFNFDMLEVIERPVKGQPLGITNPRSPLP